MLCQAALLKSKFLFALLHDNLWLFMAKPFFSERKGGKCIYKLFYPACLLVSIVIQTLQQIKSFNLCWKPQDHDCVHNSSHSWAQREGRGPPCNTIHDCIIIINHYFTWCSGIKAKRMKHPYWNIRWEREDWKERNISRSALYNTVF